MRLALLLAAMALLLAPGAAALLSVSVEVDASQNLEAAEDATAVEAETTADAGILEAETTADADILEAEATVSEGGTLAVEVDGDAVGASVEASPAGVDLDAPMVDASVEASPAPKPAPEPEPAPAYEPTPHSDIIDDPRTDPGWSPGDIDAAAEAEAALVAIPLAAGTAAAVAASLAPAATGRLLSRAGRFLGFLAFLPALGLFSRVRDDEMDDQPTRAAIMAFVRENPGVSIQEVRGAVDVAWGTAVYHLRRLEDAEHLVSERYGRSRRFWARNAPESRHRDAQAVVAADTPRALLEAVAARPGSRQKELCAAVGCSAPVASKYLKRLARQGLVSVAVSGRDRLYFLGDAATRVPTVAPSLSLVAPPPRLTETL